MTTRTTTTTTTGKAASVSVGNGDTPPLRLWRWRGTGPARKRYGLVSAPDIDEASRMVSDGLGLVTFYLSALPWPESLPRKPFAIEQKRG